MEYTPSRTNQRWTESEKRAVIKMDTDGISMRQIAIELGRTRNAVAAVLKCHRGAAHVKYYTPADDRKIAIMLSGGHSRREIAATLGRSLASIDLRIRRRQLTAVTATRKNLHPGEKASITERYSNGSSINAIALGLGRSWMCINSFIQKTRLQPLETGDVELIKALATELSANDIAEKFEISANQVQLLITQEAA